MTDSRSFCACSSNSGLSTVAIRIRNSYFGGCPTLAGFARVGFTLPTHSSHSARSRRRSRTLRRSATRRADDQFFARLQLSVQQLRNLGKRMVGDTCLHLHRYQLLFGGLFPNDRRRAPCLPGFGGRGLVTRVRLLCPL